MTCGISSVKSSYWSKFPVSIITGCKVVIFFVYKKSTKNVEIRNAPVLILPNIWRLKRFKGSKVGANVFNEQLLNAGKFEGYSFYHF